MKEFRVTFGELVLETDKRKLARAAFELALENNVKCEVTRTAAKSVKFAGLAAPAPAPAPVPVPALMPVKLTGKAPAKKT